ncbi:MAG: Lrp/AsnC family transcriptional regulator [Candidatus Nanopelagicales bacterium]|nr:Lrp/AsnC family transcriptional regulator [Candidatus Nanopelagicales bacterium]PHX60962.1 MAG: AsnC family transcriptional regulator [Actinomycetota bacterium]
MITALCFIQVTPEYVNSAGEAIAKIQGVTAAYSVTGKIDLVALIEVHSHEEIAKVVTDGISKVQGVQSTETHVSFRTFNNADLEAGFSLGAEES